MADWWNYMATNGAEGEEPPDWVKEAYEIDKTRWGVVPGTDEYKELREQGFQWHRDNLPMITIVEGVKYPLIISARMGNVASKAMPSPRTSLASSSSTKSNEVDCLRSAADCKSAPGTISNRWQSIGHVASLAGLVSKSSRLHHEQRRRIWDSAIFIVRRLIMLIPILFLISLVSFTIIELPPGDWVTYQIESLRVPAWI